MSNMLELIKELEEKNIKISLKEGNLQINFDGEMDKEILSKLKLNKEKIINFLSKNLNANSDIKNVNLLESYPISHAQKRIWIESQNEKKSKAYHINIQLDLIGDYDVQILELAISEVIKRHEILRTIYKLNDEFEIKQWIINYDEFKFKVNHFDLKYENLPLDAVKKYIQKDNDISFDLEKGPLLRVSFFQLSNSQYVLYCNMHHIVTDGWSMNILERDLLAFYEAIKSGIAHKLPNLRIQYKDYASWQLSAIEEGLYNNHKQFWIEYLSGELPKLDFPSFKTRPKLMTHHSQAMQTFLPLELTSRFKLFCNDNNGSLFMGILASIKILLSKYTEQQDIILGTVVAGRQDSDLEDQIGFYVNTLALRNQVDPNDSFLTFFEKVKKNTLSAFSHQIYPFNLLVEDLNLKMDKGRHSIFEILFSFNNTASNNFYLDETDTEDINDLGFTTSIKDLEFLFQEYGDCLSFQINFNSELYDCNTIKRFMVHYKKMLFELIDRPDQGIKTIDYLAKQEKEQLLVQFNNTRVDYPKDKTIIDLFEYQVSQTPDNIAVVFEQVELTYQQLNEKSNQLGAYLRETYSIEPDDLIGIKLERSEKMIVTILGILKSGAAYVPIDPEYPQERIEYIEQDTNAKTTIDEAFLESYHEALQKSENQFTKENLQIISRPDSLAYVIYTSGTTGQAKGVMIENKSVIDRLLYEQKILNINYSSKVVVTTNYVFDVSVLELLLPLVSGAMTVIPHPKNIFDSENYLNIIKKYKLNLLQGTPSFFANILKSENKSLINHPITICVGGESLNVETIQTLEKIFKKGKINNHYGPTETTIDAIIKENIYSADYKNNNIGQPISNTSIYILDKDLNIVPIGVSGRLYVSGAGLSRGYLNKPELTNEKFIANPFEEGTKMYDTGDLARWLPDGNIEFLGRKDFQVKIRGYRIELGEIETNISQFSTSIKQIVSEAKEVNGEKVLVAYYTKDGETKIDKNELREYLQSKLPEYMIPSFFVELESIPLTLNGKINRKALPSVKGEDLIITEYVAPRNETEQKLAEIWQEVLRVEKVGITDNFFELGGHSLKVVELIFIIQKEFDLNLDIYVFFENPTIEFLGNYIHTMNFSDLDSIGSNNNDDYLIF